MKTFRYSVVFALLTAVMMSPLSRTLLAAEDVSTAPPQATTSTSAPLLTIDSTRFAVPIGQGLVEPSFAVTASSDVDAQRRGYRGRGSYGGRRAGAAEALFIGAAAAITGAAVLAYANRPECDYNRYASACGYGTKVVGTSVLAGGVVGIMVGAALWR